MSKAVKFCLLCIAVISLMLSGVSGGPGCPIKKNKEARKRVCSLEDRFTKLSDTFNNHVQKSDAAQGQLFKEIETLTSGLATQKKEDAAIKAKLLETDKLVKGMLTAMETLEKEIFEVKAKVGAPKTHSILGGILNAGRHLIGTLFG